MTKPPAMPEPIKTAVSKLKSAQMCNPNAVQHLIEEALAALQSAQPAEVSDDGLYGTLEAAIVSRYVVEKRVGGGFWGYCVKAGDGSQEMFVGHKNACEHVRQALQTACLDGAYMAHEEARAILALRPTQQVAEVSDSKWTGAEEWMPLAWQLCANECGEEACYELVWEGGPVPEPWGDRWLKYEDEARRLIDLVRKHVPALRPAQQATPDAIREHLEGVASRASTGEQFNAFKWVIDTAFESLNLLPAQQATPEPSRGMIGMGAHALANELAQAVAQDDADPDGHDMSAGLFGPNVSAWLRKISADYLPQPATPEPVGNKRECPHCNYTGSAHCGDVDDKLKANGGDPKDCSNAKVYGLRAATPESVGDAPTWNSIQIASWIGSQLMHEPAMFERSGVCKFVRSLGRHPALLKHSPKDHVAAQPVPMTEDQVWHSDGIMSANGIAGFKFDALMRIVRAVEAFGITAQAKKDGA